MQPLRLTTGCPTIDAEVARYADVVLGADQDEIILLRYAPRFGAWYVCGCKSVHAAANGCDIREAELYWRGTGYLVDAHLAYAQFEDKPLRRPWQWNALYDQVAHRLTQQRSIKD